MPSQPQSRRPIVPGLTKWSRLLLYLIGLSLQACVATSSNAQNYPSHLVKFIVPFPPGGGVDLVIRAAARELSTMWGTPVIIENRAGAGGVLGTEAVFRAPNDGYTLLATVNQTITAAPFLYKSLRYDPSQLTPVTLMVQSDNFLLAHPSVPANTLRELIDLSKKEPEKWTYGSFGRGSQPQLIYEYLNAKEGLHLRHVPYNGIAPLLIAGISGEVSLTAGSAGVAGEYLKSGMLKALAIAGKKRSAQFPDVPTTQEAGFDYLQSSIWYAVFAPPNTPRDIVDKIATDLRTVLNRPDFVAQQITSKGLDAVASTPEQLAETVRADTSSLKIMIEAAGIQPE
jgi:tripartite-type tricarboxylate transporter receptor subunit TctC